MGLIALIYLLACGSLLFWIGFRIDTGKWRWYCTCLQLVYQWAILSTSLFFSSAAKTFNKKGMVGNGVLALFYCVRHNISTSFIVKL